MSLTPADLRAAKVFRAAQRAILEQKNASEPPDITASVYVHHERHDCARQGGKSVSLELREHYVFSPMAFVPNPPEDAAPGEFVPARRFGFIFTEGRCAACGMTARSRDSRLVDPAIRPPAARAIVT